MASCRLVYGEKSIEAGCSLDTILKREINSMEDQNIHEHRCENLKSRTKRVYLIYAKLLYTIIRSRT